ncbi:MAG: aminoacetone oxidase family FAD-binding enzyme [Verrucomicrobiota bacterium]|jgi:predicted Rossmann fold flavoprotein|nr:aminoacetone oxidase family FAD-binding enzyme [Verrucomicrobiota bacterium]
MKPSVLIIGAGPAGLVAALTLARHAPGVRIALADRLPKAGVKLAATGGGRGNISHAATEEEFAAAFGKQGRFTLPAFRALPPKAWRALLKKLGVDSFIDASGRIYPAFESAAYVRDALVKACRDGGVDWMPEHAVHSLLPPEQPEAPWQVDAMPWHTVLLSAGGRSAPSLGSDGSGFRLAQALGHELVPPVPALSALHTVETWPAALSGLSIRNAGLTFDGNRQPPGVCGEILFTHHGLSGPAVLNFSGRVARKLQTEQPVRIRLSVLPELPDFQALRRSHGTQRIGAWLSRQLPRALADTLLDLSHLPAEQTFSRLSAPQQHALSLHLNALPLSIRRTGAFAESMVTSGGVSLKNVRPDTLESRLCPRLYFAGEILDLDGPSGGYNLQWAAASGYLAGRSIAAYYEKEKT